MNGINPTFCSIYSLFLKKISIGHNYNNTFEADRQAKRQWNLSHGKPSDECALL